MPTTTPADVLLDTDKFILKIYLELQKTQYNQHNFERKLENTQSHSHLVAQRQLQSNRPDHGHRWSYSRHNHGTPGHTHPHRSAMKPSYLDGYKEEGGGYLDFGFMSCKNMNSTQITGPCKQ